MKIAEIVATFPPYHGGMGYVCFHNARGLAKLGHDVTVFTLEHGRISYENDPEDFRIERLKTPLIYGDGGVLPQLYSRLKEFDIIHLHYPFFGSAEYIYLASLIRKQKYFLTYHMDVFGTDILKKLIIGLYEPLLMKKMINRASRIGVLSMSHLRSSKISGFVDRERVVEIPNGVDIELFRPREKDEELVKKYGLENKTVALFVGNLLLLKGLHILMDAVTKINDDNLVLLVVGGGYEEEKLREMAREKEMGGRIIFAGPQSPEDKLPLYYNLCDFLVLPSLRSESFGLVVIEAMASEKPSIVSAMPGPSELIEEGKCGLTVKPGDSDDLKEKIEYLARNREICMEMGRSGRQKALEKYSWSAINESLERELLTILKD
jgi:glycosyltransferase involved in cell wall biosynthesis